MMSLTSYLQTFEQLNPNSFFSNGIVVSEKKKFIYMKSCRTGGTSILRGVLEKRVKGIIHKKNHPTAFEKWFVTISDEQLKKYFKFCFVRNPWDRLVSVAFYCIKEAKYMDCLNHIFPGTNDADSFGKFVHNYNEIINVPTFLSAMIKHHSLPCSVYTHCEGVKFVDFIGRFENLQNDFDVVCDKIGLKKQELPWKAKTAHKPYWEYYNNETRDIVTQMYKKDIEYFGYKFGDLPAYLHAHYLRVGALGEEYAKKINTV